MNDRSKQWNNFLKNKKYDIYIYGNAYLSVYCSHLLDLNEYFQKILFIFIIIKFTIIDLLGVFFNL